MCIPEVLRVAKEYRDKWSLLPLCVIQERAGMKLSVTPVLFGATTYYVLVPCFSSVQ